MPFNPFGISGGETVVPAHLVTLISNGVAEGYHVEFKAQLPAPQKIGRSIAAFANTFGGWYIVGVQTNSDNVAIAVPGFSREQTHDPIASLRDAVKAHIDPVPHFTAKVIEQPDGRLVLVTEVPAGQVGPFVTSDGRIYRRNHDSSDPVHATDKYTIDRIYERGRERAKAWAHFAKDNRYFSRLNSDGWIRVFIEPYPSAAVEKCQVRDHEELERLLAASKEPRPLMLRGQPGQISGNVPFHAAHTAGDSVVLRQIPDGNDSLRGITAELDIYGRARLFMPFWTRQLFSTSAQRHRSAKAQEVLRDRVRRAGEHGVYDLGLVELAPLLWGLAALVRFYQTWLGDNQAISSLRYAVELSNTHLCVPFFDHDIWAEHVEAVGLPVIQQDVVRNPGDPEAAWSVINDDMSWANIIGEVAQAFGLPYRFMSELISCALPDVVQYRPSMDPTAGAT